MRSSAAIKRAFHFGQSGSSWCTRCAGSRCEEDVGFLCVDGGQVQGYVIDFEKINEVVSRAYAGENRRLRDTSPSDGIYKRPKDIKKLISRQPDNINTVRFSRDLLTTLLVGVEGCDNFTSGKRRIHHRKFPQVGMFSTNTDSEELPGMSQEESSKQKKNAEGREREPGKPEGTETDPGFATEGLFKKAEESLFASDETDEGEDTAGLHDRSDYTVRIKQDHERKSDRIYWASLIVTGLVAGAVIFSLFHRQITSALFPDYPEERTSASDESADTVLKAGPEDELPVAAPLPQDRIAETEYGERHKDPTPYLLESDTGELPGDGGEAGKSVLFEGGAERHPSPEDDEEMIIRKKTRVPPAKAASREQSAYSLQVGAYGERKNAESVTEKLRQKGYEVVLREISRSDGVRLHRVLVGPFDTRKEALILSKAILQKEGLKSMVVREPFVPGKEVYSLQVGIYEAKKYADLTSKKLKLKGYDVFILRSSNTDGAFVYRVLVGEYDTRKDALQQSKSILQKEGIASFIYSH
jgi:cell division septation protein DedD